MSKSKFGMYLRQCRESLMSLQELADILGCSKPYLWDIEQGNTKPPQRYDRLDKISEALNLNRKQREKLFDLASSKDDIPLDVKKIIKDNPEIIKELRDRG